LGISIHSLQVQEEIGERHNRSWSQEERRRPIQFFFGLAFLVAIVLAIFAVQNSTAPTVTMRFLFWQFETSLVYAILGSVGSGMVIILFLWISSAIKGSIRSRNLKKEIDILERERDHQKEANKLRVP